MQKSKKRLLIVTTSQFGYLLDTYKYCQYCRDEFNITYLCWDYSREKIEMESLPVIYVSRKGNLINRNFRLLKAIHKELTKDYDVVFTSYVRGISLVKLINFRQKFVFDIRTLSVQPNPIKRIVYNFFLNLESLPFKYVTTISIGVANRLYFKKAEILPLGAEPLFREKVSRKKIYLLYVGTFQGRNIIETVKGFKRYIYKHSPRDIHFILIGDSPDQELEEIKQYIQDHNLQDFFTLTGRIKHSQLAEYFNKASIGISYIPLTKWYQHQPPTKTYEYLLAGLPVLATRTIENQRLVTKEFGVLIDDNSEAFENGISYMIESLSKFDSEKIKSYNSKYAWSAIVKHTFFPLMIKIADR